MPGKRITQHQESLYMSARQSGKSQETAAAKAAISERSGRRIEKGERLLISGERHWRTREDPFEAIWKKELVPLLEKEAQLTGLTLWEYLEDEHPGKFPFSVLRTLQRRVKQWKATEGPEKVVIFRQSVPAGQQGLSDFSHPNTEITIQDKVFTHLLYQFRFAYSGWRYVQIILGGESYSALADGLQSALTLAGGSPVEHRTDSLSAAFINSVEEQKLTQSYDALCAHYNLRATRNRGVSHENGAIECAHGSFKRRLDQALKLRGSADFVAIKDYQTFLSKVTERLNKRCQGRFKDEQLTLQALPGERFMDYSELSLKVTRSSTLEVKRVLYTVPSRMIGENVRVHVYHDRLAFFIGQTLTSTLARVYPNVGSHERGRCIDYRHVIHSLSAKPQAFRFLKFRDELLPTETYRKLWLNCDQQFQSREACKWIVGVLRIAMDHDCEERLGNELIVQVDNNKPLPTLKVLQERYLGKQTVPTIPARQHDLNSYDHLLQGNWHRMEAVGHA